MNKLIKVSALLFLMFLSGCEINKPLKFSTLPDDFEITNEINGIYHNDPCLNPFGKIKLWDLIDPKSSLKKENLYVSLTLEGKNLLHAKLVDGNLLIAENYIEIEKKGDKCFYTSQDFSFVPILPVLWWYSNDQKRFIIGENSLIVERSYNGGGAFIIMAGGNEVNDSWEYEKKK